MDQQNNARFCPKCKMRILRKERNCPNCGAVLAKSSKTGKYIKQPQHRSNYTVIIAILCVMVIILGISTVIFFLKSQKQPTIQQQESVSYSVPTEVTEVPTEESLPTAVATTTVPTELPTEAPTVTTEYTEEIATTIMTEPTEATALTGTVLRSAGELNIRSGAGTNYAAIGRLKGGDTVTIYEQKNVDGTDWGNIGSGWICLDYIAFGEDYSVTPEYNNVHKTDLSEFNGEWISYDGYWYLCITPSGTGVDLYAEYPYKAPTKTIWKMHGEYDEYTVIRYWDGSCLEHNNGAEAIKYTNGEGAINFCESGIEWHDFIEGGYRTLVRAGAHSELPEYSNNNSNPQNNAGQQSSDTQFISHPWHDEFVSDIITYIVKEAGGSNQFLGDRWRCKITITDIKDLGNGQYQVKAKGTYNEDSIQISVIFEEAKWAIDWPGLGKAGDPYVLIRKCEELVWSYNMD